MRTLAVLVREHPPTVHLLLVDPPVAVEGLADDRRGHRDVARNHGVTFLPWFTEPPRQQRGAEQEPSRRPSHALEPHEVRALGRCHRTFDSQAPPSAQHAYPSQHPRALGGRCADRGEEQHDNQRHALSQLHHRLVLPEDPSPPPVLFDRPVRPLHLQPPPRRPALVRRARPWPCSPRTCARSPAPTSPGHRAPAAALGRRGCSRPRRLRAALGESVAGARTGRGHRGRAGDADLPRRSTAA